MPEAISIDEFHKVELKVARILSVEDIIGKDRLYLLKIDVGEEQPRTIFAGIKEFYTKEQLLGKQIIIVANLQARRLGNFESQGMLLAAKAVDGSFALLKPKANASAGEKAVLPGIAAQ